MRLIEKYGTDGKPIYVTLTWSEHIISCKKCGAVNLNRTASFVNACSLGSRLLQEECIKIQAPKQKEKEKEVLEWAKRAGVFKKV